LSLGSWYLRDPQEAYVRFAAEGDGLRVRIRGVDACIVLERAATATRWREGVLG